ncbi:MAG: formylglycine-generating enzyme family protein [Anaerolineales bacterium]|nr:formylglycine-generating enzyme family protein [Anaerolineales bacterium]
MRKTAKYLFWGTVLFTLFAIAGCNLPGFEAEGSTGAPGTGGTGDQPTGPTNTDGAETILIPGATFWMGSDAVDAQADADEFPRHQVTLGSFYIYTHEVTNAMYAECVAAGACADVQVLDSGPTSHYADPAFADHPVVGVDYVMARGYCRWANGRLPTEAEWELASRGAESLRYPWGSEDPTCDRTNMFGCLVPPDTAAVGSHANGNSPEGVWDMSGNVWEWVHDWYDDDYYVLSPLNNPLGPYVGEVKVVRGGGLYSEPVQMRTAARLGANPYRSYDDVGFRCVALQETFPEEYLDAEERHEHVPPSPLDGGGEHVEEPGGDPPWWVGGASGTFTCPDLAGRIHFSVEAESSVDPTTWSVSVGGVPFDCVYDPVLGMLNCSGFPPPGFDGFGDSAPYTLCWEHALASGCVDLIGHKPVDCGEVMLPLGVTTILDCPVDGLFTVTFIADPAINWDTARISGIDIPCVVVSGTELRCTAPDLRDGIHYDFYLHGFVSGSGEEVMFGAMIPVRDDCPVEPLLSHYSSYCFEGLHPVVRIDYPPGSTGLESASVGGVPLACIGMAPGVQICGDLPGAPGTDVEVEACFTDFGCETAIVPVPDCADEDPDIGFAIDSYCHPPDAAAASIHIWPFTDPIVSGDAGGVPITCSDWGGGWYVCPGVPGAPGDITEITFCLAGGDCYDGAVAVADCPGEVPPGAGDSWRIAAIGCHDETRIYFIVDTGLDWLVPGAAYTYSATDEVGSYTCDVHPTIPGRLYCAGLRPAAPGTLQLCLHPDGGVLTCNYYADFPAWVAGVPPCGTEVPPEVPPEEPPEEPPVPTCPDFLDQGTCLTNGCIWTKGPPDWMEHCYTPPGP